MKNVIFLIEKQEGDLPCNVFALFPDTKYNSIEKYVVVSYAHIGQHSACHLDYAKECKEANYNEYEPLLKELIQQGYKGLKILNTQVFECHRKPTKIEIKFGEGATHYRSLFISEIVNKKGDIKQWFISSDDKLRYYTN